MKRIRGTQDILPENIYKWQYLEQKIRQICSLYNFEEIRTPTFEATELFLRGIGDTTDVVTKEMYTFNDRGGRSITLRPENTAAVVRSYLENKMYADNTTHKLFYIGSMFRYDRPQAGRYREFHQFGLEVLGSQDPYVDAEVIDLAVQFFKDLGLKELELHINSVGHVECRKVFHEKLIAFLEPKKDELCEDCNTRLYKNPLRVLDCKNTTCKRIIEGAPNIVDCLCDDCSEKFEKLKTYLDELGIEYIVDPLLVRGLDYYTNTAFEIMYEPLGAQSTICGGGRYDGLVNEIGGIQVPGIGMAIGMERLILALEQQNLFPEVKNENQVFIATVGEKARVKGVGIVKALRKQQIYAGTAMQEKSLKSLLKQADKEKYPFVVIIGEDELQKSKAILKNMETKEQKEIDFETLVEYIKETVK
ncbi:MAG: histidine--tRNA ligase [Dialister micraerophilus]|uniref:histidine--tRNA ligase n=1 Tax=Dialister micraerophilus TaxID=309120 RepID=UPI00254C5110|nr:histidine--tRNA ligase [Dialister micraerophilus]MDK8253854.1 histidine--tRNA ligase [Dialister micraerophilus]